MSSEGQEGPTAEVLVGVKTPTVLSAHHIHKVRGQHEGGPLTLEPLKNWGDKLCSHKACINLR